MAKPTTVADALELLRACDLALLDWMRTYADDQFAREDVWQSLLRIGDGGGTLVYIAKLRASIDAYLAASPVREPPRELHIVFDGFPSHDGPRFIEVEDGSGKSINAGEWRRRDDGFCELIIAAPSPTRE